MSLQKIATLASSLTAFLLLFIKFSVWIISWSIAVLSSAIDSMLDLFVSLFNYFAVHNSEKEADDKFNYGKGKIEALACFIEWLIISLSWCYIFYVSILKLINNEKVSYLWVSILIMIISVILTGFLVYFLEYVANKTWNLVIKSDSLHYKTDLFSNAWILIWLAVIHFTWFYYIDAIIWIIIAIYIVYSAWELVQKGYLLLLDVAIDVNEVNKIVEIINSQKLVTWYNELRTRQVWNIKFVEINLVFNSKMLLVDAHKIGDHIEHQIPKIDKKCQWNVMLHLEAFNEQ